MCSVRSVHVRYARARDKQRMSTTVYLVKGAKIKRYELDSSQVDSMKNNM